MLKTTVAQGFLSTLLFVLLVSTALADKSATETSSTIENIKTNQLNQHIQALNELTERRRVSRFFNVQSSLTQGLTKNYVSTSTGQLQFELRDLVLPGRTIAMASRVYDSALASGDFGKGWELSLTAANELVITRNAANRVTSITDKHGRKIQYSYNKQGLLETTTDLGGQVWQYRYFGNGLLKEVIDPEGHSAASFKYDKQDRVRFSQVRAVKTNYQYSDHKTVVFEDKNQTTFRFNSKGVTTSITNAERLTSSVKLNDNHQVIELSHDDQLIAAFTYLPDGRTESITQDNKASFLQYNVQNQFTGLLQDGEVLMGIKLDSEGRPLSISGDGATRQYTYYPNGDVATFKSGDIDRTFHYYPNGLLKQLVENGKTASFEYNPLSRLQKITFPTGEVHEYQYDNRGFRKYTTKNNGSKLHYNYDKTGNYRGNTTTDAKGEQTIKEIILDQHNQVKQQLIDGRLVMDVQYQRGNPKSLSHGEHTIEYDFDKLSRLNKISNGLAEPIEYTYANDEDDLRLQQDDRTVGVYLNKKETSLASTLYTRTTQTPWPHIIWNEALGQLQLASKTGIIPPDSVFLSAAKRRRLYDAVARNKQSSKDFDKPSSSFWTPPEYLATNCDPTECMIYGVFFDPIGPIYLGQPVEISALAESDLSCEPNYTFYVDGQIVYSTSSFSSVPYTFNTVGNHEIKVISRCSCSESNVWGVWAVEQVTVQSPSCTVDFTLNGSGDYMIGANPVMPTITATVSAKSPANATVKWQAQITHSAPDTGSCSGGPNFDSAVVAASGDTFTPNFNGFYGGQLTISATCEAQGYLESTKTNNTRKVLGSEPTDAVKGSYLTNNLSSPFDSYDLRRISCHESSLQQFANSGFPLYSGTGAGDAGLMQICYQRTNERVWNWQRNADFGQAILNDALNGARQWLNSRVEAGAVPYTSDQLRQEAIHRYNAGCCGASNRYFDWLNGAWRVVDLGGIGGYVTTIVSKGATCTN